MSLHTRVLRLDFWDLKFTGLAGVVFGILLARYRLELLDISVWWWLSLMLLLMARPLYHFWMKPARA